MPSGRPKTDSFVGRVKSVPPHPGRHRVKVVRSKFDEFVGASGLVAFCAIAGRIAFRLRLRCVAQRRTADLVGLAPRTPGLKRHERFVLRVGGGKLASPQDTIRTVKKGSTVGERASLIALRSPFRRERLRRGPLRHHLSDCNPASIARRAGGIHLDVKRPGLLPSVDASRKSALWEMTLRNPDGSQ